MHACTFSYSMACFNYFCTSKLSFATGSINVFKLLKTHLLTDIDVAPGGHGPPTFLALKVGVVMYLIIVS